MGDTTRRLDEVLENTHFNNVNKYLNENHEDLQSDIAFADYMNDMKKKKKFIWKDIYIAINMTEKYGNEILHRTKVPQKRRDYIIEICVAAKFTFDETQKALKLYESFPLYPRDARDCVVIVALRDRIYDFDRINQKLVEQGLPIFDLNRNSKDE